MAARFRNDASAPWPVRYYGLLFFNTEERRRATEFVVAPPTANGYTMTPIINRSIDRSVNNMI
jgi:hypothetical protein